VNSSTFLLAAIATLAACVSQPNPAAPMVIEKNKIASLVHKDDSITYSLGDKQENSFCVTAVSEKEIHSTGPLVVQISEIRRLVVEPQACNPKGNALREVGRTAGAVLLTPIVLVCVASGNCSMK
jgi:hypothetical protein